MCLQFLAPQGQPDRPFTPRMKGRFFLRPELCALGYLSWRSLLTHGYLRLGRAEPAQFTRARCVVDEPDTFFLSLDLE